MQKVTLTITEHIASSSPVKLAQVKASLVQLAKMLRDQGVFPRDAYWEVAEYPVAGELGPEDASPETYVDGDRQAMTVGPGKIPARSMGCHVSCSVEDCAICAVRALFSNIREIDERLKDLVPENYPRYWRELELRAMYTTALSIRAKAVRDEIAGVGLKPFDQLKEEVIERAKLSVDAALEPDGVHKRSIGLVITTGDEAIGKEKDWHPGVEKVDMAMRYEPGVSYKDASTDFLEAEFAEANRRIVECDDSERAILIARRNEVAAELVSRKAGHEPKE